MKYLPDDISRQTIIHERIEFKLKNLKLYR